jgi:putative ABC transport system substrate-binding protein
MFARPAAAHILAAALGLLALSPVPAAAQAKVGFVSFQGHALAAHIDHFKAGMTALGHVEGKTYELDFHFTGGNREQTQEIVEALIKKPVDVLVVQVTPVAHIAKEATKTIPIVMLVSDALATGLVPSLSRPGGNLTGATMAGPDLAGKRLEILREIRPSIKTVAFIGSSRDSNGKTFARETQAAADRIGLKLLTTFVDDPAEINEALFTRFKREGAEVAILQPIFTGAGARIVPIAAKAGLPVIGDYPPLAQAGALFSFGVDDSERIKRLAYLRRSHPQGRETRRPASRAADVVQACRQREDRKNLRLAGLRHVPAAGRSRHRIAPGAVRRERRRARVDATGNAA